MKNRIKSITLYFPQSSEGDIVHYVVGKDGVTLIQECEKYGEMAMLKYYQVWKGEELFCDMHDFSQIIYETLSH